MRELLSDAYMARIEFHLEFEERFHFKQQMLLHLRRELAAVARSSENEQLVHFINPDPPDDPYARRLFQKPSPPFVVKASESCDFILEAGDSFVLKVLFFGNLTANIRRFALLLQQLGEKGLFKGDGKFELEMIVGRDQAGHKQMLWRGVDLAEDFIVPQISLLWHVEDRPFQTDALDLVFKTPARLLSEKKPLFKPSFVEIFPFLLRRVTSMLYSWSGLEINGDTQYLLSLATEASVACCHLEWRDWRRLDGSEHYQNLGGLTGSIRFESINSESLTTLLVLGELLHIGRGAAYGAGEYHLSAAQ